MRRAAIAWVLAVSGVATAAAPRTWNFDKDVVGKPAAGWSVVTGSWETVETPSAPSKPNVFAQVSKHHSGGYFSIAIDERSSLRDLSLTVQTCAVAGNEDQGGGPIWRYADPNNYYVTRHNSLEDNYCVYKVVNGQRMQLGSAEVKARAGSWHTLKVTMVDDHIQCFFDGEKQLDVKDGTFREAGKVGLWTKADAQTRFDNLRIEAR